MNFQDIKSHLLQPGTQSLGNEAADWQIVKRSDGVLLQYRLGKYKYYNNIQALALAAWYRVKNG